MMLLSFCLITAVLIIGTWCFFLNSHKRVLNLYHKKMDINAKQDRLVMQSMDLIKWLAHVDAGVWEVSEYDEHYSQKNMERDTFYAMVDPIHRNRVHQSLDDLKTGKAAVMHEEYRFAMELGAPRIWVETYATVTERADDGHALTLVGTTVSINNRKKVNHETQDAMQKKTEEVDCMKASLLANVSHEVRTPLNQLVGFSHALLLTKDGAEQNQYMKIIEQSSSTLLSLFDTLLDISRLESNTYVLEPVSFNLLSFFSELTNKIRLVYGNQNIAFLVNGRIPDIIVHQDIQALERLMRHLLDNAFKFTDSGEIEIGCSCEHNGKLRFYVRDTGCGVETAQQDLIFEQFIQTNSFSQGIGLGLTYCKDIVMKMGGEIGCDSAVGYGSEFWFTLPQKK